MPVHDTIINDIPNQPSDPYFKDLTTTPTSGALQNASGNRVFLTTLIPGVITKQPEEYDALRLDDAFPYEHQMNKTYFLPLDQNTGISEIDAGLIASEVSFPVSLLNLRDGTKGDPIAVCTDITVVNGVGTSLDNPPTPFYIIGLESFDLTLTILENGPPVQDSQYIFTINGEIFTLLVKARRLEPLDPAFEPNWDRPYKFQYIFETVVKTSKTFYEQRRPLFAEMKRIITCSFWNNGDDFGKIHTVLQNAVEKVFSVPVWQEALLPTNSPIVGVSILTFDVDLQYYFNLFKATQVIVKSTRDPSITETLVIDSIDTVLNRITLTSPTSKAFVVNQTVVYPLFNAILSEFKPKYITDQVVEFNVKFEELRDTE